MILFAMVHLVGIFYYYHLKPTHFPVLFYVFLVELLELICIVSPFGFVRHMSKTLRVVE
jgi:hypothetical protein